VNKRHNIDKTKVSAQIAENIVSHEKLRIRLKKEAVERQDKYDAAKASGVTGIRSPQSPHYIDPMIDSWIRQELEYYSLVRVIELPQDGKRFILVYGDADDETVDKGTGPFDSFEDSAQWFLTSGR